MTSFNLIRRQPIRFIQTVYPLRVITIGHDVEYGYGKRSNVKTRPKPPLVPILPRAQQSINMNLLLRYSDLKLRWKHHKKPINLHLKRKRRLRLSWLPEPKPTCAFILHSQMPHKKKMGELPSIPNLNSDDIFAVFKPSIDKQYKVTKGDLILTSYIRRKQAGDKVVFGTVLLAGSLHWTILGKPTIPYARVLGTIEQQTLSKDQLCFSYLKGSKWSNLSRTKRFVSIIHIDDIIIDPNAKPLLTIPRPVRLIDLWANRWLDPDEMNGVLYKNDGITPQVEDIYDGREVSHNLYHNRGLTDCYRFTPDPLALSEGLFSEKRQLYQPK